MESNIKYRRYVAGIYFAGLVTGIVITTLGGMYWYWIRERTFTPVVPDEPDIVQAVQYGQANRVKSMLDSNPLLADAYNTQGVPVLYMAVDQRDLDMVRLLLQYHANPNVFEKPSREYPLSRAVILGEEEITQLLIEYGAGVNARDTFLGTALHYACAVQNDDGSIGHINIIKLLLANCAHVNAQDRAGETPLFVAVRYENTKIINELLAAGARTDIVSHSGERVTDLTTNEEILRLLRKK